MRKLRITLLIGITAMLLYSCQREFSDENGNTPTNPLDSQNLLKRYIRLDTTLSAPNDTVFTANYFYDNLNRCTTILYKFFDHPQSAYEGTVNERIFYSGSDTLMSHRILINVNQFETDTTAEYFTYDANGKVVRDSVVSPDNDASFYYRYEGNLIHSVSYFVPNSADSFEYTTHHLQKVNGNIVFERDSAYEVQGPWPYGTPTTARTDAQYDNHPNPLYRVSPPWPVLFEIEHILHHGEFFTQQKNNVLSSYEEFDGWLPGESEEFVHQYTYLPNGYPSIARIHYVTGDMYFKAIYQY